MDASPVLFLLPSPTVDDPQAPPVRADPTAAQLRVDDLGVTRGDGVFETINAVDGDPQALDHHLARLARSAAMLDLPAPAIDTWRRAVFDAVEAHPRVPELLLKLVMTRGVEGGDRATGWVLAFPSGDLTRERTEGIDVITLDRGYPADVMTTAPWLLQGAKTLSYALNMAALRYAHSQGADDAVFVNSEGHVLEGPTSTIVAKFGVLLMTPPGELGVLDGTSQHRLFRWAQERGMSTAYARLTVEDLHAADTLWICSSSRLAVPVRTLDGKPRPWDREASAAVLHHLLTTKD